MTFDNPFAFVVFGAGSGLIMGLALHYTFVYIGASKAFAARFIGG